MTAPHDRFSKWKLPQKSGEPGTFTKTPTFHDEIDMAKYQIATIMQNKKNGKNLKAETLTELKRLNKELNYYRNWFLHNKLQSLRGEEDPEAPVLWDDVMAETMVSHAIYTRAAHGQQERAVTITPIQYILRDAERWKGTNLPEIYRTAVAEGEEREGAIKIWKHLHDFMTTDSGVEIGRGLRGSEQADAPVMMQGLRDIMSEAVLDNDAGHAATGTMGVEYTGSNKKALKFTHPSGEVLFDVQLGSIDTDDLDENLVQPYTKKIVNRTIASWAQATLGLFVSIAIRYVDGSETEHYLFLSEYCQNALKATTAIGSSDEFLSTEVQMNEDGTPPYQQLFWALHPHLMDIPPRVAGRATWKVSHPLTEQMLVGDHITNLNHMKGLDLREPLDEFSELLGKDETEIPVQTQFFSGDNLAFVVTVFHTEVPWVKAMLGSPDADYYISVTVVRYPVLFTNIEGFMHRMRYKYFLQHRVQGEDWRGWKQRLRRSQRPRVVRGFDPKQFQAPPDVEDPLNFPVLDHHNRETRQFSEVVSLPRSANWSALKRERERERRIRKLKVKSYYVNNIESDPSVVYRYYMANTDETDAVWDSLQLFRVNAEIKVSKAAAEQDLQSFFEFRTENSERFREQEKHPFKEYLQRYPILRILWATLWMEGQNNLEGWDRIEQASFDEQAAPAGDRREEPARDRREEPARDRPARDRPEGPARERPEGPARERPEGPARDRPEGPARDRREEPAVRPPNGPPVGPKRNDALTRAEVEALSERRMWSPADLEVASSIKTWLRIKLKYIPEREGLPWFAKLCQETVRTIGASDPGQCWRVLNQANDGVRGTQDGAKRMWEVTKRVMQAGKARQKYQKAKGTVKKGKQALDDQKKKQERRHAQQPKKIRFGASNENAMRRYNERFLLMRVH
jgi:hypothetical protein